MTIANEARAMLKTLRKHLVDVRLRMADAVGQMTGLLEVTASVLIPIHFKSEPMEEIYFLVARLTWDLKQGETLSLQECFLSLL